MASLINQANRFSNMTSVKSWIFSGVKKPVVLKGLDLYAAVVCGVIFILLVLFVLLLLCYYMNWKIRTRNKNKEYLGLLEQ